MPLTLDTLQDPVSVLADLCDRILYITWTHSFTVTSLDYDKQTLLCIFLVDAVMDACQKPLNYHILQSKTTVSFRQKKNEKEMNLTMGPKEEG